MIADLNGPIAWALNFSLVALCLGVLAALVRVIRGPTLSDRVVALDLVAYLAMGFLGTYAVVSEQEAYVDAALVLGLLAFLGTIGLSRYIERFVEQEARMRREEASEGKPSHKQPHSER